VDKRAQDELKSERESAPAVSAAPAAPPPLRSLRLRRRPHAMMLNLGPPGPRTSFGTPCLKRLFTSICGQADDTRHVM